MITLGAESLNECSLERVFADKVFHRVHWNSEKKCAHMRILQQRQHRTLASGCWWHMFVRVFLFRASSLILSHGADGLYALALLRVLCICIILPWIFFQTSTDILATDAEHHATSRSCVNIPTWDGARQSRCCFVVSVRALL